MKDIEQVIELENIVREHKDSLDRLIAYSVRGLLVPNTFTIELAKMQKRTLNRCLSTLSDDEKELASKYILERLQTMNNFIKIRDRLYNVNLIMYVEEFQDSERIFCPEINGDKIKDFTSSRLYFSKDDYIQIRGFTIKELQEISNNKNASQ